MNALSAKPTMDAALERCHSVAGWHVAVFAAVSMLAGCTPAPRSKLSFNETIQPILSANCYGCHGPDSGSRKAGLRLDRQEGAFAPHAEFGPAIIPGKPDKSPLIRRIEAKDPKERMPPPEAHKTLKPEQIALLRQWVEEGAHYEPHWAFITPRRPAVPSSDSANQWARNAIDQFIVERLEKEGIAPSLEADKRTLIRRLTYDLTGLPPTRAEVDAFLADLSSNAYEKVVDRLLASPRYGEHRAHYWLDYVRYADTHGLHIDNYRAIWPYRDYVIKAYNQNKPFDAFVREQLAGDLLPERTLDGLLATGYMRANPTTHEGGTILEEVFVNLTRDRVETFGVTFLGLTTGCAACHDHKFDPTSQKDFYQLAAFLNNTADAPMDFNSHDPPPVLRLPDDKDRAAYENLVRESGRLAARLAERHEQAQALMKAKLAAGTGPRAVSTNGLELRLRFDEGKGQTLANSAPKPATAQFKTEVLPIVWGESDWLWPSARFDSNTQLPLGKIGDVEAHEAFSVGGWIMPRGHFQADTEVKAVLARLGDPQGSNRSGWELSFQIYKFFGHNTYPSGRFIVSLANDSAPRSTKRPEKKKELYALQSPPVVEPMKRAIQVSTRADLLTEQWVHLFVTYDGSRQAKGVRIYLDGKLAQTDILNDSLRPGDSIHTDTITQLGRRGDDSAAFREARYQDIRFYRRALSTEEVARLPFEDVAAEIVARQPDPAKWTPEEVFVALERYLLGEQDEEAKRLRADIDSVQARLEALAPADKPDTSAKRTSEKLTAPAEVLRALLKQRPSSLIAQERSTPAYAHILKRGDYATRLERVRPGTPHFLPALPAGAAPNRLTLANWLVAPENPLFARVAVNRVWQELFGTGLVETAGDFGLMGARPSHPKLLDWLAVEFRESGWNVKHLYKILVLSATYRQSAHVTPEILRIDPANRLLARGPRFRMDAEAIRDSALAVSGLLVNKIGGPPVKPYQPPGLWQEVAMIGSNTSEYAPDSGEGQYRRSLYTFLKRSSAPPSMETFDATSRETACLRRARANTPLQALVTLNDPQFLEAARVLAQNVMRGSADTVSRMEALAQITLSRPLDEAEKAILERSRKAFTQQFEAQPQQARELLRVGVTASDSNLSSPELAAWTLVASHFLNLDEFLNK